jgi:uncharacterized membrane protein
MGNEFSIAFFIHPSLSRVDHRRFLPAIQVFARLFGRVMPFWMAGTLVFHFVLAWAVRTAHQGTRYILSAAFIWLFVIMFSLIFPVPINNRVAGWDPSAPPVNWESERRRWDIYNTIRVICIICAFTLLVAAFKQQA